MSDAYPVFAGAEAWAAEGHGERARIALGLIHGFTGNPVSMRPLGEALASRGFAVEVPRLPGHGTHWRDLARTRYDDWRSEVIATVGRLQRRADAVVLVGLSMGGTLVLDVGTERQDALEGLFTINAALSGPKGFQAALGPLVARVVAALPGAFAGLAKNDIAKGGDERAYPMMPLLSAQSIVDAFPRVRAALPSLRLPLVVAYSSQDHSVPNVSSKDAMRLAGSSDKTELVLARSYHVATLDHDAPLLEDAIARFADRVAASLGPDAAKSAG